MKKYIFLVLMMVLCSAGYAEELETIRATPILISYVEDANATALDVNTTAWASLSSWVDIPSNFNRLAVFFYAYGDDDGAGDPNGATFSYQFYLAPYYCNARLMCYGTAAVGFSHLSNNPISGAELASGAVDPNYCWVDTLGTITEDLPETIGTENDGGTDDIACFIIDRRFAIKVWCRIYNKSGATNIYCIAYGY